MRSASRSARRPFEIWPGYVDVLSTLLMVVIFVLMVFVIAQFFLSNALSGRDKALEQLNRQVAELSELRSARESATKRRLRSCPGSTSPTFPTSSSRRSATATR